MSFSKTRKIGVRIRKDNCPKAKCQYYTVFAPKQQYFRLKVETKNDKYNRPLKKPKKGVL